MRRVVRYDINKTFTSGQGTMSIEALKKFLVSNRVISSAEAYRADLHAHSEQELAQYLITERQVLAERLVKMSGGTGEYAVGVILDLVSIPNTICNPCHKSLEALFTQGSSWLEGFLTALDTSGIRRGREVQTIIRASAENIFKGASTQIQAAQKNKTFESDVDVSSHSSTPVFLEHVTNLEGLRTAQITLVKAIKKRAAADLIKKELKPGEVFDLKIRMPAKLTENLIGTTFDHGDRRFEVTKVKSGVTLRRLGIAPPSNLRTMITERYGPIQTISGLRMSCYIRSVVTGIANLGLLGQSNVGEMVATIEDHLESLALRFEGETIDAGGLAAAEVRAALQQLISTSPQIGITIVQWDPTRGELVDFTVNSGTNMITLLYTPGHFDLITRRA